MSEAVFTHDIGFGLQVGNIDDRRAALSAVVAAQPYRQGSAIDNFMYCLQVIFSTSAVICAIALVAHRRTIAIAADNRKFAFHPSLLSRCTLLIPH